MEPVAAPTPRKLPLASSLRLASGTTSRINGALSLGEQFRQVVRLLRLTCRAADGPAPPSLTLNRHGHSKSWTMPLIGVNLAWANRPDLILMDIRLPHISGLEVTRRLRDDDRSKEIPIIAVTAFAMKWHEREVLDSGCDAYLSKPITSSACWMRSSRSCFAR
jgi:two-component system, cell cycle response regulator DivK